ncbi:hypothetical protein [Methylorubrum aminovorans]
MSDAVRAVVAARELVRQRRRYMDLPADRPLPSNVEAALAEAEAAS